MMMINDACRLPVIPLATLNDANRLTVLALVLCVLLVGSLCWLAFRPDGDDGGDDGGDEDDDD